MQKFLSLFCLVLLMPLLLVGFLIIDFSPSVQVSSGEQVNEAQSVNILLNQARDVLRDREIPHRIEISPSQANSLAGFLQRAGLNAQAIVSFQQDEALVDLSYHLGSFVFDFYVNTEMSLVSGQGLQLHRVKVGDISLRGSWALALAEALFNWKTSSKAATEAINWVTQLDVTAERLVVDVKPSQSLILSLKDMRGSPDNEQTRLLKAQVVHYLKYLDALPPESFQPHVSLAYYLSALMSEAKKQSAHNEATQENEAAILALAIYAGNYRFARLVGQLSIAVEDLPTSPKPTVINGRSDLSLHFVYSAAIKLLSEKGISIAVGEFKELMDRRQGGSGYSFIDLAADLSGTHFAELAVAPESASKVQTMLIDQGLESTFFPSVDMLDEGLNVQAFANKYQAVDSPAYQAALDLINQRIAELPISITE